LSLSGCGDCLGSGRESGAESVAGRAEDLPGVGFDRLAQDGVMALQGSMHGLRLAFPKPGAAFDISIKEGDRAGGEICHRFLGEQVGGEAGEDLHPSSA
jgi:hypothetical protein